MEQYETTRDQQGPIPLQSPLQCSLWVVTPPDVHVPAKLLQPQMAGAPCDSWQL